MGQRKAPNERNSRSPLGDVFATTDVSWLDVTSSVSGALANKDGPPAMAGLVGMDGLCGDGGLLSKVTGRRSNGEDANELEEDAEGN